MGIVHTVMKNFLNPTIEEIETYYASLESEVVYRNLAIETCIDLIANAMLKVEYRTFSDKHRVKNELYYRLNVSPNGKQNASEFYKKLIHKLYYDNEVLIVSPSRKNSELYIADSFSIEQRALRPDTFTQVSVDNLMFDKTFSEKDVLYLKLADRRIRGVIDRFYSSYGKLLSSAMNIYKRSNAKHYVLKGDLFHRQDRSGQDQLNKMMTAQFKPFMEADNAGAVFQLQEGFELKDFSSSIKADSRDVRNLLDDIMDMTSTAFHVPNGLLKGDVAGLGDQIDGFLMFVVHPLVSLWTDEVNTKIFDMDEYLEGTYVSADTTNIKVTDITAMATALDKLFSIGAMSVNDISEKVGSDPIDEDWANKRYVTKNYSEAEQLVKALKGGDKDEQEEKPQHLSI